MIGEPLRTALVLVAAILGVMALGKSRGNDVTAWAVLLLALVLLFR